MFFHISKLAKPKVEPTVNHIQPFQGFALETVSILKIDTVFLL
jgi:hypothetical protein